MVERLLMFQSECEARPINLMDTVVGVEQEASFVNKQKATQSTSSCHSGPSHGRLLQVISSAK